MRLLKLVTRQPSSTMDLNESKKQLIMFTNHQLPHQVVLAQFVINA
jgi:hypothetical protein